MPRVRAVTPTVAEELRDLKARYFHYVDLKQWDELRGLFVDDCVFEGLWAAAPDPDTFVENLMRNMTEEVVSVHHGFMPQFRRIDDFSARGRWAMTDYLTWPRGSRGYMGITVPEQRGMRGYGYYEELYRLTESGRRIAFMRLSRIRMDPIVGDAPAIDYPVVPAVPGWLD